jgi:hypothetical protein
MSTTLDAIHADAEAIEHALVAGLLTDATEVPDSDVVAAIALVAREARLAPGGLAALFAEDYWACPEAFARRMHTALALAEHLNHAAAPAAQNGEQHA